MRVIVAHSNSFIPSKCKTTPVPKGEMSFKKCPTSVRRGATPGTPRNICISHRFYGNGGTKFSKKCWNVTDPPIITVVRKASFDLVHSLKDQKQTGEAIFRAMLHGKFIR